MKLPKYWTTVTPLSKTIALILFIALPFIGFYLGISYQQNIDRVNQKMTYVLPVKTEDWKTYTNPSNNFSFHYPANWTLKLSKAENLNQQINDQNIELNGAEGKVDIYWADEWGGACGSSGYEKIKIDDQTFNVCHELNSPKTGMESWGQVSKIFNPNTHLGIDIEGYANSPINKNRETILKILDSFKFEN